jgi:cation diffusion facilitator family transporter
LSWPAPEAGLNEAKPDYTAWHGAQMAADDQRGSRDARQAGKQRASRLRRTLAVALVANLAVAAAKVSYGELSGSVAMGADGLHSLLDAGASVVGLVGVTLASRPPDVGHPYGYERYESLTALVIGAFLVLALLRILSGAVARMLAPAPATVTWVSFAIMGFSMVVSSGIAWWERRRATTLASELLHADAMHTFSDVLLSAAVVGALAGVAWGVPLLDPVVACGVALVLGWVAWGVLRTATSSLTDAASVDLEAVMAAARRVPGVVDCHAVRARGTSGRVRVDLHILVDGAMRVDRAHDVATAVGRAVQTRIADVVEVLVHIGPAQGHSER